MNYTTNKLIKIIELSISQNETIYLKTNVEYKRLIEQLDINDDELT